MSDSVSESCPALCATYATGTFTNVVRDVPVEVPVNLIFSSVSYAVMMITPQDMEDFALGFSLTEGIADAPSDIREIEVTPLDTGFSLNVALTADKLQRHLSRGRGDKARAMVGRTGCGVCGLDDLKNLPHAKPRLQTKPVALGAIQNALRTLDQRQPLNALTHAVHAAAFATLDGEIIAVREDVGRHNALDKLIGALSQASVDPANGFCIITSRCSFEMVEKAAVFGAHTLVSISAPTSLAVERARQHDIALVAIARSDSAMIFHAADRIQDLPSQTGHAGIKGRA